MKLNCIETLLYIIWYFILLLPQMGNRLVARMNTTRFRYWFDPLSPPHAQIFAVMEAELIYFK